MDELKNQLKFNFETEFEIKMQNTKSKNSKPMSGEEYKQKIRLATERYLKRKGLHHATDSN